MKLDQRWREIFVASLFLPPPLRSWFTFRENGKRERERGKRKFRLGRGPNLNGPLGRSASLLSFSEQIKIIKWSFRLESQFGRVRRRKKRGRIEYVQVEYIYIYKYKQNILYILTYYKLVEIPSKIKPLLHFFSHASFAYFYYIR